MFARAIGTVQAFQSVVVRARVDGTWTASCYGRSIREAGDVLAQLDPRPYQAILDQAIARKASDLSIAANARSDLSRYDDLAASQIASQQKLEQVRATLAQAEAAVRGDDASIAAAQLNLGFTRITSPIEGRVGLRQIDAGNFIRPADPNTTGIVTIAQIHPISLIFTLPQDELPRVQAAMRRGKLPVMAFSSDDKHQTERGRAADPGQQHRQHDGHHQAQGGVRQHGRQPLARPVRQCPDATRPAGGGCDTAVPGSPARRRTGFTSTLSRPIVRRRCSRSKWTRMTDRWPWCRRAWPGRSGLCLPGNPGSAAAPALMRPMRSRRADRMDPTWQETWA